MGREIKFRAWNKELKSMSKPFSFGQILNFNDKNIKSITHEIIMQLTDLKDKNGKQIYEGDILKGTNNGYVNGYYTPVDFYKGSFNITIQYDMQFLPIGDFDSVWLKNEFKGDKDTSLWINEFEVVGNIHENPELIK